NPLPVYDILANTSDTNRIYIVKLTLTLDYDTNNTNLGKELSGKSDQISNIILMTLISTKKIDVDDNTGRGKFKALLMKNIDKILSEGKVDDIYYNNFTIY